MASNPLRTGPLNPSMLFWYLDRFCHREDRVCFYDPDGQPDPRAARNYAEQMRSRLALAIPDWARHFAVTQSGHEVVVTSNLSVPLKADLAWYRATRTKLLETRTARQPAATR